MRLAVNQPRHRLSPANFPLTTRRPLKAMIDTGGRETSCPGPALLQGRPYAARGCRRAQTRTIFELAGRWAADAQGAVAWLRTELMELIQYGRPPRVRHRAVLIVPSVREKVISGPILPRAEHVVSRFRAASRTFTISCSKSRPDQTDPSRHSTRTSARSSRRLNAVCSRSPERDGRHTRPCAPAASCWRSRSPTRAQGNQHRVARHVACRCEAVTTVNRGSLTGLYARDRRPGV